jgi:hypothetical protein
MFLHSGDFFMDFAMTVLILDMYGRSDMYEKWELK